MLERINQELKRRTHVIRIFPNEHSALRLIRALAVEIHEDWIEAHRYLNMEMLREQRKQLQLLEAPKVNATASHKPVALTCVSAGALPLRAPAPTASAFVNTYPFSNSYQISLLLNLTNTTVNPRFWHCPVEDTCHHARRPVTEGRLAQDSRRKTGGSGPTRAEGNLAKG